MDARRRGGTARRGGPFPPPGRILPAFPRAKRVPPKTPRRNGAGLRQRWIDPDDGRIFEWDSQHGSVEVYARRGKPHLGEFDPYTGRQLKGPNPQYEVEP
ncbi:MAG TPA: colicin E3/pyocin S6 family cytotoxin [Stellaceae bacterium]|nr:colicin E3/pyocin S6 family cytotoxin [Stellaceae bacterium]